MMDRITDELHGKNRGRHAPFASGTPEPGPELCFAMEGWGNDEKIHVTLKDLKPADRIAIPEEYRESFTG